MKSTLRVGDPLAIELPSHQLHSGTNDLGEIRLETQGVLVAGRIEADAPDAFHRVQLAFERKDDNAWSQILNLAPQWSSDGRFSVRSEIAAGTLLRIKVEDGEFLPVPPIECKAGDTGIVIPLHSVGLVAATFLIDEHVPPDRLEFRLRSTQASHHPDPQRDFLERISDHGASLEGGRLRKEWKGVQPGSYRLVASCKGIETPLCTIDAIQVGEGPCKDPRLVDIDLRGRAQVVEIRATAPDGRPLADRDAYVIVRDAGKDWCGFNLAKGVVEFAVPGPVDVMVLAPHCRTAVAEFVTGSRTIALQAAVEASVRLELPRALPDQVQCRLHLKPKLALPDAAQIMLDTGRGMPLADYLVEDASFGPDGTALVAVCWPGDYAVEGSLTAPGHGNLTIRSFEPKTITLPASGEVELSIQKDALDGLLKALSR